MSANDTLDELRERADDAIRKLRGLATDDEVTAAKALVLELRNARAYERMGRLAEAVSRIDPKDATNRRLYAQCLIETGKATAAVDVLDKLARRLPKGHPEHVEATGLLGRAFKQLFFDAPDKTSAGAREALKRAIEAYRRPYEDDPANTWHGVNLVALLTRARRLGIRMAPDLHPKAIAKLVVAALEAVPEAERDEWFLPTLAEASLGLSDWDAVERNLNAYVADKKAEAFLVASTLRQLEQVWDLEHGDERGRRLLDILRARLVELRGGEVKLAPDTLQQLRSAAEPDSGQLEAILGKRGPQTYKWWRTGLDRALAVAAIWDGMGRRMGTGFLVRAGDFGLEPADERLVLTNFHVVNQHGASPGIRPDEAEIAFEAVDSDRHHRVKEIVWSSPPDRHDASFLRLEAPVAEEIEPMPLATALPTVEPDALVYIIGHPGGRDLQFSFQDNDLLDHEGPPRGEPQVPNVCRVHYEAPTEGGSSGSPVFNASQWKVIALHHKGGRTGMPRLNGKDGTYGANEGICVQSIRAAIVSG